MERIGSVKLQLEELFSESLKEIAPTEVTVKPLITPYKDPKFGNYQCNNAMGLFRLVRERFGKPELVGQAIKDNLPASDVIQSCSVAKTGFINVILSREWMAKRIQNMLRDGIATWGPKVPVKRAIVDFSSPNIAKEMHVGHVRSTIIGDCIARMLEFSDVEVLRRNHVGDWGTQFGMLIEHLFDKFPNWEIAGIPIGDLEAFYKESKQRFDKDPAFKGRARQAVVRLQAGEENYLRAWAQICEISRIEFQKIYQRLNIELEERGESFYNPHIPKVLQMLTDTGLVEESDGARVINVKEFKRPLIVVKEDGGYNYTSTDLTALWYRLNEEKAEWIIYVTDVGQTEHFDMFFAAARLAGWLPTESESYPKVSHVGFGLVLGNDGKRFRTRSSTKVMKLVDHLDEAKTRCFGDLKERGERYGWTEEEVEQTAEAVGYGAVKYADLKNNRLTNYTFNPKEILNDKGNTAVYLLYAHARICSIIRRSGRDMEELKQVATLNLDHKDERTLGLHLVQFPEAVEEACANLLPSILCDYLYNLSQDFTTFYTNCQVNGSAEEESRLLLCEATAVVMRKCFHLLGITPVYRI